MSVIGKLTSKAVCRLAGGAMDLALTRFPPLVRIETVNACNSRCAICRHSAMGRRMQQMDQGLFEQIVDECAAWGCREIHLHNFGEPLLDDRLEDRVRFAKQKGVAKVTIFSNGSLLDESRAAGLIAAGLDEIKISFDGADKEEFERIRHPLKFDVVVGNLARLKDLRARLRSPMRIFIACCSTSDKRSTERVLAGLVDGVTFSKMHNWTDAGSLNGQHGVRKPCARLWQTLTVLTSGDVALCCLDYDGQHILGRVGPGVSLRDVWQSPAYEEIRRRHKDARQGEIGLCRSCSKSYF